MSDNKPCVDIPSIKTYPVASALPVECPIITPSIDERSAYAKYKKRGYIDEQTIISKIKTDFTPVHSSTPTPTITPTYTPTPTVTPTVTPTPGNTPPVTPTATPTHTGTPAVTPTHKPKIQLQLFVSMTVYTEVQFVYSFLTREAMIFHAVNGPFPLNPVNFLWVILQDGLLVEQGSADWNIGWKMTRYDEKRFFQTDSFLAAAAIGYGAVGAAVAVGIAAGVIGVGSSTALATTLALAGPVGWVAAGVVAILALFLNLFGLGHKKPPAEEPRPQWSRPAFVVPYNTVLIPTSPSKFKFIKGNPPDTVFSGGIAMEYPPSQENLYNVTLSIKDTSPGAHTTDDAWNFTFVVEN